MKGEKKEKRKRREKEKHVSQIMLLIVFFSENLGHIPIIHYADCGIVFYMCCQLAEYGQMNEYGVGGFARFIKYYEINDGTLSDANRKENRLLMGTVSWNTVEPRMAREFKRFFTLLKKRLIILNQQ